MQFTRWHAPFSAERRKIYLIKTKDRFGGIIWGDSDVGHRCGLLVARQEKPEIIYLTHLITNDQNI